MKLAIIISTNNPETNWNALRLANLLSNKAKILACGTRLKLREQERLKLVR